MEEADIILILLKKGKKEGLERLFREFYNPLVIYAYRFLNDQAEAEDVVQEVFIRFWNRNQFSDIQQYLRAYLYRTVHNYCLNRLEGRKGAAVVPLEELRNFPAEERKEEEELLWRLDEIYREVGKLPERSRRVVQAVFLENKRYKEVAQQEQISVNTVKTLLQRSLGLLRKRLGGEALVLFNIFFPYK